MGKFHSSTLLLCLFALAVGIPGAQAQWAPDGCLVAAGGGHESEPQIISDDDGGAVTCG